MSGKVALITGASSGIGRATALAFARKGAGVVLAARREDELGPGGGDRGSRRKATYLRTDVSVAADVEAMVDHAIQTYGRLDFAVNNAGIEGELHGITDYPEAV
jgi:NAD(P)-dependent dehydrogenase (short-subunit alcohol dehydrogenase family)